ncbi:hypothetical protein SERLA73DRAFT_174877 [Serpula lacrymans var. lacrymans S7.3]|uniref:Uncharacterized protein n=2 Tax=Serpula lacrymans var. lacrymans TaxID=341189 RepID=F8PJ45_SERL3|nr:uncharacterized protein SERLADRAFT_456572 [Serpula lacrymans var. lacrymans S7.9]EGO03409.1 hypothetical protein SERLA73DRAFT_174877 [Serpula lacrymans var. lacrymans S7.3]EGO29177.1 hypothetical protein SERLADRAFT_456572 [Serpula lacrymans var. lacrymans S7.9]
MSMELSGMDMKDAHRYNHWQSISWGMYDDLDGDNSGPKWKRIEDGQFELSEGDVLGIYQTLFGKPIEDAKDEEGVIKRRRKLVNTVRLLFAVVGIGYHIACVDEEKDCESGYRYGGPGGMGYMLEGLSDTWIARGVRRACGFQLTKDPEQALSGTQERAEMEADDPYDNDEEFGEYITYYR